MLLSIKRIRADRPGQNQELVSPEYKPKTKQTKK